MPTYLRRHLMIRGEYARLILSGRKRATVRIGKVVPKYNEVIIHSWGRPIAKAKITRVVYKRVKELTDEDALKDGFRDRGELIKELRKVYGGVGPNDVVTIIEFDVTFKFDELTPDDPYLGLKPPDIGRLALRYLRSNFTKDEVRVLEEVAKGGSIRRVARKLTGSPLNRVTVRKVLRKALKLLIAKKIITPS